MLGFGLGLILFLFLLLLVPTVLSVMFIIGFRDVLKDRLTFLTVDEVVETLHKSKLDIFINQAEDITFQLNEQIVKRLEKIKNAS